MRIGSSGGAARCAELVPPSGLSNGGDRSTSAAGRPGLSASSTPFQAEWDAGDLGCGDLVLELRQRLRALGGGEVLRLVARDPGAPADLPAWCGMTGHALLGAHHPVYLIQRKKE